MANPIANVIYPTGGSSSAPTVYNEAAPVISFWYQDTDGNTLDKVRVRVFEGTTTRYDSGFNYMPFDDVMGNMFGSGLANTWRTTNSTIPNTETVTYFFPIPASAGLTYGKVYNVQVEVQDSTGAISTATDKRYFELNRGPLAISLSPYGDYNGPYLLNDNLTPEFTWSFSDPDTGDTQAAFQVQIVEDPRRGTEVNFNSLNIVYNSGEVRSTANKYKIPAGVLLTGKNYRWRVRVKDNNEFWGVWSEDLDLRTNTTPNVPINPLPAGGSKAYPALVPGDLYPTFVWSYLDQDSSDDQAAFQVRVFDALGLPFADSGVINSAEKSWKCTAKMTYEDVYQWEVRTKDPYGQWSSYTTRGWISPIVATVSGVTSVPDTQNGANIISWDPADTDDLEGYYVYRATSPSGPFKQISRAIMSETTWTDDHVASKKEYYYKIQTQAGGGFKSALSAVTVSSTADFDFWFIGSFKFQGVTELMKKRERAQSMRFALGSGAPKRIIQDRGFIPGEQISLTIYLYDDDHAGGMTGQQKYDALLDELEKTTLVSVRDPFGRQWRTAPGDFEDEQLKTGKLEYVCKFTLQEVVY